MKNNDCNGNCELKKSLKQFDDNEKKMNSFLKDKSELVYIQYDSKINLEVTPTTTSTEKKFPVLNPKTRSISLSNFRPPTYFI